MRKIDYVILGGLTSILIMLGIVLIGGGNQQPLVIRGDTNYDSLDVTDGYKLNGVTVLDGSGNLAITGTAAVTGTLSVTGATSVQEFTQGGGCLATSTTASSETLLQSDLLNYNCFLVSGQDDSMTLTLPATSTMTTLLANVGDTREWLFYFATTTTATLTIAAGAGIDLVAVTADNDVIDHTEYAELKCTRTYSTGAALDVVCIVSELIQAD